MVKVSVRRPHARSRDLRWPASENLHHSGPRASHDSFLKADITIHAVVGKMNERGLSAFVRSPPKTDRRYQRSVRTSGGLTVLRWHDNKGCRFN